VSEDCLGINHGTETRREGAGNSKSNGRLAKTVTAGRWRWWFSTAAGAAAALLVCTFRLISTRYSGDTAVIPVRYLGAHFVT
jgi:hypothetical protein